MRGDIGKEHEGTEEVGGLVDEEGGEVFLIETGTEFLVGLVRLHPLETREGLGFNIQLLSSLEKVVQDL